jgi:hypothetical protein
MTLGVAVHGRVRRKAVWDSGLRVLVAAGVAASVASCGELTRQGTASSYLIVTALEGASGAKPDEFGGTLRSDVLTMIEDVPTIFNDIGRVRMTLGLKDPGSSTSPNAPTTNNLITVNRYRVQYIRTDGKNTPGVDVPNAIDGAITFTVGDAESIAGFDLVRHTSKREAPLRALAFNFTILSTIAEVTFYGRDQTGREVSVTARMTIDFGNFSDPE